MKKKLLAWMVCGALLFGSTTVLPANGLNLNGVGARAIAMGGAFLGLADDFTAIYWNPAGMVQIKRPVIGLFETNLIPKGTYRFPALGIDTATKASVYPSGALGYIKPISDKLTLGILAYVPSGSGAEWDGAALAKLSGGKEFVWKSFIAILSVSPAMAYQISKHLSVGASLNINYGMLKLQRPVGLGQYKEDAHAVTVNANLGFLLKPVEEVAIGFSVRTPTKVNFAGTAEMPGAALVGLPGESDLDRQGNQPLWLGGGVALKLIPNLTVTADVQFTNWVELDTIPVEYTDPGWNQTALQARFGYGDLDLKWQNTTQVRLGLEYTVSPSLKLRAGYYTDPAPSPESTLTVLLPNISYQGFTVGFGYQNERITLDAGIEYMKGKEREVVYRMGLMPGFHNMNLVVPNISFAYKF